VRFVRQVADGVVVGSAFITAADAAEADGADVAGLTSRIGEIVSTLVGGTVRFDHASYMSSHDNRPCDVLPS